MKFQLQLINLFLHFLLEVIGVDGVKESKTMFFQSQIFGVEAVPASLETHQTKLRWGLHPPLSWAPPLGQGPSCPFIALDPCLFVPLRPPPSSPRAIATVVALPPTGGHVDPPPVLPLALRSGGSPCLSLSLPGPTGLGGWARAGPAPFVPPGRGGWGSPSGRHVVACGVGWAAGWARGGA